MNSILDAPKDERANCQVLRLATERSCHGPQKAMSFSVDLGVIDRFPSSRNPTPSLPSIPRFESRPVLLYTAHVAWINGGGAGEEG